MSLDGVLSKGRRRAGGWTLVLISASLVAVAGPLPTVSWNDGSRLAAVESLVDYGTWAIDDSIFVNASRVEPGAPLPYEPCERTAGTGTLDKMFIGGHYYSDKSPVPSLLMAGVYKALQWTTGLDARSQPDVFIGVMTLATSGVAYVTAVAAIYFLALRLLPASQALALTASFGLATGAAAYSRQVSSYMILLATAALLTLGLEVFRERLVAGRRPILLAAALGALVGFGYGTDLGTGFTLLVTVVPLVAYRRRQARHGGAGIFAVFLLAALPWIAVHHALNYRIGGSLVPASANPAHFEWPGSPWGRVDVLESQPPPTGRWHHSHPVEAGVYALKLLVGRKGFFLNNPVMLLAVPAWILFLRRKPRMAQRPELLFGVAWGVTTWLLYAALSSEMHWSYRWLLPLLAPGYFAIALLLRERPGFWRHFLVLSATGLVIAWLTWRIGAFAGEVPGSRSALWTLLFLWVVLAVYSRFQSLAERGPTPSASG